MRKQTPILMKAETYFKTQILERLNRYIEGREAYFDLSEGQHTKHTKFNFGELTSSRMLFFNTIRHLSRLYPIIILRDEYNLDEGLTIVGRKNFIDHFIEIFAAIIQAVERDLEKIPRPSKRLEKRTLILKAINHDLECLVSKVPYDPKSQKLLSLAKEYRKNISTLRIKKSFYGK